MTRGSVELGLLARNGPALRSPAVYPTVGYDPTYGSGASSGTGPPRPLATGRTRATGQRARRRPSGLRADVPAAGCRSTQQKISIFRTRTQPDHVCRAATRSATCLSTLHGHIDSAAAVGNGALDLDLSALDAAQSSRTRAPGCQPRDWRFDQHAWFPPDSERQRADQPGDVIDRCDWRRLADR